MKKIAILVVTYNRLECLKKWIELVRNLKIKDGYQYVPFIIDNHSTDDTELYMKKIEIENDNNFKYYRLDENTGGSGGFSFGVKQTIEEGMDFIWGMDDDAYPEYDSLYNLISIYETFSNNVCLYSNSNFDSDFKNGRYKKVLSWMFVGFFIPKEIVLDIGYPRNDFFIYHDDTEYASRISIKYEIYKVKSSIINHRNGVAEMLPSRKLFNKKIEFYKLPDWKLYYFIRNSILKYPVSNFKYYKEIIRVIIKYMFPIIYLSPRQFKVFIIGLLHGVFRISGKKYSPN